MTPAEDPPVSPSLLRDGGEPQAALPFALWLNQAKLRLKLPSREGRMRTGK